MSITIPGLLLQSIPYLGQKKILKVFSPEQGLLSFFVQNTKHSPFLLAEWVYRKSEKEMLTLQDSTLLDPLLHIRENYNTLIAAGAIAQDLLRTQMPGKRAPELFDLALFYLRKLSTSPELLVASFRLKLLLHEGLLSEEPHPSFTPAEWEQVHTLAFSRKLSTIQNLSPVPQSKIQLLLEERTGLRNY